MGNPSLSKDRAAYTRHPGAACNVSVIGRVDLTRSMMSWYSRPSTEVSLTATRRASARTGESSEEGLRELEEADLMELGMKKIEIKRLLRSVTP